MVVATTATTVYSELSCDIMSQIDSEKCKTKLLLLFIQHIRSCAFAEAGKDCFLAAARG